jgi:hypothetical protein
MKDRYLFLIGSATGVLRLVVKHKPEYHCILLSLIAGFLMGGFTMHKIVYGDETERIAIAQIAGASTCVCTITFTLSCLLIDQGRRR